MKIEKMISKDLYFGLILSLMIEGMMEVTIISTYNIRTYMTTSIGEWLGFIQACVSIFIICIVLPIINIFAILCSYFYGIIHSKSKIRKIFWNHF